LFFQNEAEEEKEECVAGYVEDVEMEEDGCENSPWEDGRGKIALNQQIDDDIIQMYRLEKVADYCTDDNVDRD